MPEGPMPGGTPSEGPPPEVVTTEQALVTYVLGNTTQIAGNVWPSGLTTQYLLVPVPPLPIHPSTSSAHNGTYCIDNGGHIDANGVTGDMNRICFEWQRNGSTYTAVANVTATDGGNNVYYYNSLLSFTGIQPNWSFTMSWNTNENSVWNLQGEVDDADRILVSRAHASFQVYFGAGVQPYLARSPRIRLSSSTPANCVKDFPYANDGGIDCYSPIVSRYGTGTGLPSDGTAAAFSAPTSQSVCNMHVTHGPTFEDIEWEI